MVFQVSGQPLIKKNYHNTRTSDDIDMKLGSVTKINKEIRTTSKKLTMTSLLFFQCIANLEQSGSQVPGAQSVKVISS